MRHRSYTTIYIVRALAGRLFDPLFLFYWLCWFLIRFTRIYNIQIPFLNDWLTDFVFVPIIAHVALVLSNTFFMKRGTIGFSLSNVLCISIYVSVIYEAVLPALSSTTRADWIDVVAYFLGGIFYYHIHQRYSLVKWGNQI